MMEPVRLKEMDPHFMEEVIAAGGKNVQLCYQCGTCTGGCPTAYKMDHPPRKIIRMIQLGMKKRVLESATIWVCASCNTCTTRCPRGVEIAHVMGALKSIAIREGVKPQNPKGPVFYRSFVEGTEAFGRIFEPKLMLDVHLKGDPSLAEAFRCLIKEAPFGLQMARRGRIALMPERIRGREQMRKIYENVKRMEAEGA
jgi:heterodisulfide reductase subunit C